MVLAGHMADAPEWLRWARQHREGKGRAPPRNTQAGQAVEDKLRVWKMRKGGCLGQLQAGVRTLIRPQLFPPLLAPPHARVQAPASSKASHIRQEEAPGEEGILHPKAFTPSLQLRT